MFVHLAKAKRDKKLLDLDSTFHSLSATGTTKNYFYQASGFVHYFIILSDSFF